MAKALFLCHYLNGAPTLPPMDDAAGGVQIAYTENGERTGGYCCMCAPRAGDPPTVVVMVHSTEAALDAIAERSDCAFIEDVEDADGEAPV